MLYRQIIAVCSEIHTKHINKLCGQNVELVNVKPGGTYVCFSPYRAVNTLTLGYKNQSVNTIQGNNRCLFSDPYKYTVWGERGICEC